MVRDEATSWEIGERLLPDLSAVSGAIWTKADHGFLVLDIRRAVVAANPKARTLLAQGDPLFLADGTMRCRDNADDAALRRLVETVEGRSETLALCNRVGRFTLTVDHIVSAEDGILLRLKPFEIGTVLANAATAIARATGLTRAECDVLRDALAGAAPGDTASKRGVSIETVRTQLRRIYKKVGVASRSELWARVLGLG